MDFAGNAESHWTEMDLFVFLATKSIRNTRMNHENGIKNTVYALLVAKMSFSETRRTARSAERKKQNGRKRQGNETGINLMSIII